MENIIHFGHEHPLMFEESEEIQQYRCNACGLFVLQSPCYMCTIQGCNVYLHQACTQLPLELHHYFDMGTDRYYYPVVKHALELLAKPRDDVKRLCGKCGKLCEKFTYHCSECEFVLHPLCGFPLDIQIKHISHPQHPMAVACKEVLSLCDVCGRKHEGYFYSCHKCNFWVHQDCVLLPSFVEIKEHHHPLSLVYSVSSLRFVFCYAQCLICSKRAITEFGIYFCFTCKICTHVDCAISRKKDDSGTLIFHLPIASSDTFMSSIMRSMLVKKRTITEGNSTGMLEKYHEHSLVLRDDTPQESLVCNACIEPISPPYYTCSAHSKCNFLLHEFCADLPLSIKDPIHVTVTNGLVSPRSDEFFSLFSCDSCGKYCNGFGYSSGKYKAIVNDVECSFAPRVIKHDSHKQHALILSLSYLLIGSWIPCCGKAWWCLYYCSSCNLGIHIHCSRLHKTVTHKFDEHPLTLTSVSQHRNDGTDDHDICEFCEEDIDPRYWFYHCAECDQSFHVDCIPSQGKFSKIKFGGTVKLPCHEDHPLALERMLNTGSQSCGICHEIIQGFEDGMALHCEDCDFWIHFICGYRSWGPTVSTPYLSLSEVEHHSNYY